MRFVVAMGKTHDALIHSAYTSSIDQDAEDKDNFGRAVEIPSIFGRSYGVIMRLTSSRRFLFKSSFLLHFTPLHSTQGIVPVDYCANFTLQRLIHER